MNVDAPVADPWCTASRHGSLTARTTYGCKCQVTRDLAARYQRGRDLDALEGRPRRVDATGSLRRLRGLMRLGWSAREIGKRMGASRCVVEGLARDKQWVSPATAAAVRKVYDELSMRVPPDNRYTRQVRETAERKGWAPPLAWDDDTIDDPKARPHVSPHWSGPLFDEAVVDRVVMEGVKPRRLTHEEAAEAVRRLRRMGVSDWSLEHEYQFQPNRYPRERVAS